MDIHVDQSCNVGQVQHTLHCHYVSGIHSHDMEALSGTDERFDSLHTNVLILLVKKSLNAYMMRYFDLIEAGALK